MRTVGLAAAGVGVAALVWAGAGCIDPGSVTVVGSGVETSLDGRTDTVVFAFYDKITTNVKATFTGTTMPHGSGGSDRPIECDGRTFVHIVLTGAHAHDMRGVGTTQGAVYPRNAASIAELCMIEDYEGYVHYAVGLTTTKAPQLKVYRTGSLMRVMIAKT